jgi:hypothetical protein
MAEKKSKISVDWWSVILATGAVLLVRFGLIPHIPW